MTEMFGEAWSPMSVPDLAPDDDDDDLPFVFGRSNFDRLMSFIVFNVSSGNNSNRLCNSHIFPLSLFPFYISRA